MKRTWLALLLVLISAQGIFASTTITSSQIQVDASGILNPNLFITGATPWDFTGTNYLSLTNIDEISVTLRLLDGDTDTGDFDEGQLMLELDGLNTGLALNGFTDGDIPPYTAVTHTVTGANLSAALLAALQTDGYLLGSILDLSVNDNGVRVIDGYSATLSLTDNGVSVVPVPSALLLGSLGVAAISGLKRRRLLSV